MKIDKICEEIYDYKLKNNIEPKKIVVSKSIFKKFFSPLVKNNSKRFYNSYKLTYMNLVIVIEEGLHGWYLK